MFFDEPTRYDSSYRDVRTQTGLQLELAPFQMSRMFIFQWFGQYVLHPVCFFDERPDPEWADGDLCHPSAKFIDI